ncbi:MAG: C_GCAxxG_C_C family protein [Oscillospiraceae bacterium]|nr:C_GCAxxG_C_C family protein [Oscillospiraceae bacterium]
MAAITEEEARYRLFDQGFDCAQTVFSAFAEELDLDEETALKIAAGFGGGMHLGDMCGCVTGGLMVLGLKYGWSEEGDAVGKDLMNRKAQEYERRFLERLGGLRCRELLEADVSTSEGKMLAAERIPDRCPGFAAAATEILEEMLED